MGRCSGERPLCQIKGDQVAGSGREREDRSDGPNRQFFIVQQHLPDAELIVYPDSGHGAIFQFPARFVREAITFLDR
jgi:hypothetical protein